MSEDEGKMTQQEVGLSMLIAKVQKQETRGYATKEALVDVAKFVLSSPRKFTHEEYSEAVQLLAKYHLAPLVGRHGRKLIEKEANARWQARCAKCGLPISSKISLATGFGIVCRRRLKISESVNECELTLLRTGRQSV